MNIQLPEIGMPCTVGVGSDRYAAKVTKILSAKRIEITKKGDSEGRIWSLRKDGHWRPKGSDDRSGYGLTLGVAREYRDPSF